MRFSRLTVAAAALIVVGTLGLAGADGSGPTPSAQNPQQQAFENWYAAQPHVYLPVDRQGAAVLVVKFSDYQCPPCKQAYLNDLPILAKYEKQFPGAVRLVVKDFPLSPGCNPLVKQAVHPAACEAAAAVRMARARNRGAEMEQWLFSHQEQLTPAVVRDAARSVAGVTDFDQAYAKAIEQVTLDVKLGQALGVQQTPTFFINGVRFNGEPVPQFFDMAIAYELQRARKTQTPVR
jgi:protein-disulfide isomerase